MPLKKESEKIQSILDTVNMIEDDSIVWADKNDLSWLLPFPIDTLWLRLGAKLPENATLAQKAISYWYGMQPDYFNGGLDQFVWNRFVYIPTAIDAFKHVGAEQTALLLENLYQQCCKEMSTFKKSDDVISSFLHYRQAVDEILFDLDPILEVSDAILCFAKKFPEQFI